MKQTKILTHVTHVNGWFPAVYMSYISQNCRLYHVSNLFVLNFRIFRLMYPGSLTATTVADLPPSPTSRRRFFPSRKRRLGRGMSCCCLIPVHCTVHRRRPQRDSRVASRRRPSAKTLASGIYCHQIITQNAGLLPRSRLAVAREWRHSRSLGRHLRHFSTPVCVI